MAHKELLAATQKLLDAIGAGNYASYSSMCAADCTSFEPETQGHLVAGAAFHKHFFDLDAAITRLAAAKDSPPAESAACRRGNASSDRGGASIAGQDCEGERRAARRGGRVA